MAKFSLKILDKSGIILYEDSAENMANLVVNREYEPGDCIIVETSEQNIHVWLQVDDALGASFVYLTDNIHYTVPFDKARTNISPKAFAGKRHYLYVRAAMEEEIYGYRNLAKNTCDQHSIANIYPHATANVETRGEAVFFACNAIDGVCENRGHGGWPYQSWGINQQDDAAITIDFGRMIETDKVVMFTRADFPHDNWWTQVTLTFSDGTSIDWELTKSRFAHTLTFEKKQITWVQMNHMIKADDPSPFPALTQLEVYGTVVK